MPEHRRTSPYAAPTGTVGKRPFITVQKARFSKRWYATVRAGNNRTLFTSQIYQNLEDCLKAVEVIRKQVNELTVVDVQG